MQWYENEILKYWYNVTAKLCVVWVTTLFYTRFRHPASQKISNRFVTFEEVNWNSGDWFVKWINHLEGGHLVWLFFFSVMTHWELTLNADYYCSPSQFVQALDRKNLVKCNEPEMSYACSRKRFYFFVYMVANAFSSGSRVKNQQRWSTNNSWYC